MDTLLSTRQVILFSSLTNSILLQVEHSAALCSQPFFKLIEHVNRVLKASLTGQPSGTNNIEIIYDRYLDDRVMNMLVCGTLSIWNKIIDANS